MPEDDDVIWKDVLSSRVDRVGYSPSTQTLFVTWAKGGKTSAYMNVPPDVADAFSKSWSVGQAVNEMLTGKYQMVYVA